MDIQMILVFVLFAAALVYVGRIIYKSIYNADEGCSSHCKGCSADFSNIPTPKK